MDDQVLWIVQLQMRDIERSHSFDGSGERHVDLRATSGLTELPAQMPQCSQSSRTVESLPLAVVAEAHALTLATAARDVNSA